MWLDKLNKIKEEKALYDEKLNKGVEEKILKRFNRNIKVRGFGVSLPYDYVKFLSMVNGLEFNGYIIYGVDDTVSYFVPNQKIYGFCLNNFDKEVPNSIVIGESEDIWYIYDYSTRSYFEYDYLAKEKLNEYNDLDELLDVVLEKALA